MPTLICPRCGTPQAVDPHAAPGTAVCVRCGQPLPHGAFAAGAPLPSVQPVQPEPVADWVEPVASGGPPFPGVVKAAGIIWIVFGGLILLNFAVLVLIVLVLAPPEVRAAAIGGTMCAGTLVGLIGGVFILVGVQTVTATARDTLGNGIGSIIFSLLVGGAGLIGLVGGRLVEARGGPADVIGAGINLLAGGGLMAAGVMALIGRDGYRAWKQYHSGSGPRRRWER